MADERRTGDERAWKHDPEVSLTMLPAHSEPFRWLPKHGEPLCVGEWFTQRMVKLLPVFTLIVVAVSLMLQIWTLLR